MPQKILVAKKGGNIKELKEMKRNRKKLEKRYLDSLNSGKGKLVI